VCFQKEIQLIPHSELTDLESVGQGGYGYVYKAKHLHFGTVLYKELNAKKLGDRYSKTVFVQCVYFIKRLIQYKC